MPELLLQSSIDLSTSAQPAGQFYAAVLVLVVAAGLIVALRYRARYSGLEGDNARHRAALIGSMKDQTPRSIHVGFDDDVRQLVTELESLFDSGGRYVDGRAAFLDAVRSMRVAIRQSMRPVTDRVSQLVVRLVTLSALVALFGALAVSTEAVIYYLGGRLTIDDLQRPVDELVRLTREVIAAGDQVVASFPYGAEVWDLAFALATLAWEWAYLHWPEVAVTLLLLAAAIGIIERRLVSDVDTRLFEEWGLLWVLTVGGVTLTWLVGVVPASVGERYGFPMAGRQLGFVLAALAFALFAGVSLRYFVEQLRRTARAAEDATGLVRTYLLVRRAGVMAAVPSAVLVLAYIVVLVATDKGGRLATAVVEADLSVQLGLVSVVLLLGIAIGYLVRASWPDLQQAMRETWSRARVRGVLLERGVPYVGIFAGYLVAYSFTDDIVIGLLLAFVGGATGYLLWGLLERAKYRVSFRERPRRRPRDVIVQGYGLEDDDGKGHLFAVVNGTIRIARDDPGELVDEIAEAVEAVESGERYGPTLGTFHAENLLDRGIVDEDESWRAALERARKTIMTELRPVGRPTPRDRLERAGRSVPQDAWEAGKTELAGDVLVERGDAVELISDPWAEERRRGSSRPSVTALF